MGFRVAMKKLSIDSECPGVDPPAHHHLRQHLPGVQRDVLASACGLSDIVPAREQPLHDLSASRVCRHKGRHASPSTRGGEQAAQRIEEGAIVDAELHRMPASACRWGDGKKRGEGG